MTACLANEEEEEEEENVEKGRKSKDDHSENQTNIRKAASSLSLPNQPTDQPTTSIS